MARVGDQPASGRDTYIVSRGTQPMVTAQVHYRQWAATTINVRKQAARQVRTKIHAVACETLPLRPTPVFCRLSDSCRRCPLLVVASGGGKPRCSEPP